ncbi:MAG: LuxR C-terminal-related transcriptional regulator [Myroides sp.]|jgi:DNA-binding CsgD family transcriptional regulator|nr:LuxR C-terminal-related transcriptional regulator [Myroides sp.]
MKAIFRHKPINILQTLIYTLLLLWGGISYANTSDSSFEKATSELIFSPISSNFNTQYAQDNQGNSWLKITVPSHLLNKPLILQFPSTHVNDYCIYVKQKDKWIKINKNTDLNGGLIVPQYQENHFITTHSIIYLKSKRAYINNGDFILVERGEYRSVILSTMIKLEVFYSLFLISIALNFGLYFIFKDKVTLIYCLFIISVIVICLLEDGLFYFLSEGQYNEMLTLGILIPVSCLMFSFFVYLFSDIQRLSNKLKYLYLSIFILFVILGILLYLTNNRQYFIILINSALLTALISITLALIYFRRDLSIRIVAYSFSIVALAAIGYYLSIYPGNQLLSFIDMDKIRIILSIAFVVSGYAIWIKVKRLKVDHESLKTEFESLKANQAQTIYEDLKRKEKTPSFHTEENPIKEQSLQDVLKEKYQCTDREIEVIICIWEGLSNQEIAEKLSISLSTTKQHVSNAYIKMEVKNRSQAMILKHTINT